MFSSLAVKESRKDRCGRVPHNDGGVPVLGRNIDARELAEEVRQLLLVNLAKRVTLRDLEIATGCTPFQIIKVFRRWIGTTPHMFIIEARIRRAIELLEKGSTAAQVAQDVGFVDQSHLIRHFKRVCGTTPTRYVQRKISRIVSDDATAGSLYCG